MRRLAIKISALAVLFVFSACESTSKPTEELPLESLEDVDSLAVLIHFEHSVVGISRESLERDVLEALRQAGVRVSRGGPPYLHVRMYSRAGAATAAEQDSRGSPASWHFGIWVDQNPDYRRDSGPLTNLCPFESAVWSRGGYGRAADGELARSLRSWLSEFVEDYRAANTAG
jgi:hypothetical protein